MNANPLAPLAFLLWGPLTLYLFARFTPPLAASISVVGAAILLPVGYGWNLPGLPLIDREMIAVVFVLLACAIYAQDRLRLPRNAPAIDALAIAMVLGGFLTAATNGDAFQMGGKQLPPVPLWSGMSRTATAVFTFWLPLYLGRILFRSPRDLRLLLLVFAIAGVLYGFLAFWESRMSPHLHNMLYGYHPASFGQSKRSTFIGWGWRPMVFVGHGIALSKFICVCLIALVALWRQRIRIAGFRAGPLAAWVSFVLLMCQSLAAVLYAAIAAPLLCFARLRWNRALLSVLLVVTFTYPALRAADLFPTQAFVAMAHLVSEDRAASLNFRFVNEDQLLARARQRPWFGWGGYGRERIYDDRGESETTSDGFWVIMMGQSGVVGYACALGMILLPAAVALRALRGRSPSGDTTTVLGVVWILVVCAIDLLPNGFLSVWTLFAGGAVLGAVGGGKRSARRRAPVMTPRRVAGEVPERSAAVARTLGGPESGRSSKPPR